jgi:mannose-6-phosphate isomerase
VPLSTTAPADLNRPLPMHFNPVHRFYTGGGLTQRFRGMTRPTDSLWSEDWVGSTTTASNLDPTNQPQGLTRVTVEGGATLTLQALVERFPEQMLGRASLEAFGPVTGVLVKMLSPAGPVPVHAHPSRSWAKQHLDSPYGKTEAWVILETPDNGEPAQAGIGLAPGTTRDSFLAAAQRFDRQALRDSLNAATLAPGDVYVAAGGIPHCLGPGELFIEVQEPSDHICIAEVEPDQEADDAAWRAGLEMINFDGDDARQSVDFARQGSRVLRRVAQSTELALVEPWVTEFFDIRRLQVVDQLAVEDDRFSVAVVTSGDGFVEGDFGREPVTRGEAFVFPAAVPHRFHAGRDELTVVRCLGPDPAFDGGAAEPSAQQTKGA